MNVELRLKKQKLRAVTLAGLCALLAFAASGAPITYSRISQLPASEQSQWNEYLQRSKTNALANEAALKQEVTAAKLTNAIRAPAGGDFKLPAEPGASWYASTEAGQLADIILSYQSPSGGWSKHTAYSKGPRQPGMQWTSQSAPGRPPHYLATFDNHATTEEMLFLASIWQATKREDCKAGFIKGLKFILSAQFPNGGWPQVYPLEGDYHDDITFNDDAMTHVLELLQAIERNEPPYAFFNQSQRRDAADALAIGIRCALRAQVVQAGKKTGWCAQHDALSLEPSNARAMEPAALSGSESAHIVEFLMTVTNPSPEIITSIEGGLAWLEKVKITGLSRTKRQGKTVFESNPDSTEIYWARFYNLTNNQPLFPGRDGIIYASYQTMAASNHLGYDYLSTLPKSIVNNGQKKWRKMLAARKPDATPD